jgi:putative pyruvate formate lyase activating enzyme
MMHGNRKVRITRERVEASQRHLDDCHLCPHECGPARTTGQGVCRVGQQTYIASEMLHVGEEASISPAHAVFFSGCTAHCTFCSAARYAFNATYGTLATPQALTKAIRRRMAQGARTLEFVGGEPTPHIPFVLETLSLLAPGECPPVVWNSNFYLTSDALDLLDGVVDIWLPDLKFGNEDCARQLSRMRDYWKIVTHAILWAAPRGDVIVRHLLMPGHKHCCTVPVLAWIEANMPQAKLSVLDQYIPPPTYNVRLES